MSEKQEFDLRIDRSPGPGSGNEISPAILINGEEQNRELPSILTQLVDLPKQQDQIAEDAYKNAYTKALETSDDNFKRGIALEEIGDIKGAIKAFSLALDTHGNNPLCHACLGLCLEKTQQVSQAVDSFRRAIELDKGNSRYLVCLGDLYVKQKKFVTAIHTYNEGYQLDTTNIEIMEKIGGVYFELRDFEKAEGWLDKAVTFDANAFGAWEKLAFTYFHLKKYVELVRTILNINWFNTDAELLYLLGFANLELKKKQQALQSFEDAVRINPSHLKANMLLGKLCYDQKRYNRAIRCFDRCVRISPEWATAWYNRGLVQQKMDQPDAAGRSFRKAVEHRADYFEAYMQLGNYYRAKNNAKQALTNYDLAVNLDPKSSEAWCGLGIIYDQLGLYSESLRSLEKAQFYGKQGFEFLRQLGRSYMQCERFERAIEIFTSMNRQFDEHGYLWAWIGNCYEKLNQPDRVIESYRKAVAIEPKYIQGSYYLVKTYLGMGREPEARVVYESVKLLPTENQTMDLFKAKLALLFDDLGQACRHFENCNQQEGIEFDHVSYLRVLYALGRYERFIHLFNGENTTRILNALSKLERVELLLLAARACFYSEAYERAISCLDQVFKLQKQNGDAIFYAGMTLLKIGDIGQSEAYLTQLEAWSAEDPRAYLLGGMIESAKGKWDVAEMFFKKSVQENPSLMDGYHYFAQFYFQQGKFEGAYKVLQQALRQQPYCKDALYQYARAANAIGKVNSAIKALEYCTNDFIGLRDEDVPFIRVMELLVQLYIDDGAYENAQALIDRIKELEPKSLGTYIVAGDLYRVQGEFEMAKKVFHTGLVVYPTSKDLACGLAEILLRQGLVDEAGIRLEMLVGEAPKHIKANILLTECYCMTNKFKAAEKQRQRSIALLEDAVRAQSDFKQVFSLARLYEEADNWLLAETFYGQAHHQKPYDVNIMYTYAACLFQNGKLKNAVERLEVLISQDPDYADAYHLFGLVCYELLDFTRARKMLIEAISRDPKKAKNYEVLGQIHYETEDFSDALNALEKSRELDPAASVTLYLLGRLYTHFNQISKAVYMFQSLLASHPKHADAHFELGKIYVNLVEPAKANYHLIHAANLGNKEASHFRKRHQSFIREADHE